MTRWEDEKAELTDVSFNVALNFIKAKFLKLNKNSTYLNVQPESMIPNKYLSSIY